MTQPEDQLPGELLAICSPADVTPALLALAKQHCDGRLRRARRVLETMDCLVDKVGAIRLVCDKIPGEYRILDLCVEAEAKFLDPEEAD